MEELFYLPPGHDVEFGDIYSDMPSVHVEERPLRVARFFNEKGERETWGVHREDAAPPQGGFKWQPDRGGENIIAKAFRGTAIVLSHDCEIENDPRHRLLAMVRPITDIQPEHQQNILNLRNWAAFPLDADPSLGIPLSFVDFRRLTTVRPVVLLPDRRVASTSPTVRKALAERFWGYLMRPNEVGGGSA